MMAESSPALISEAVANLSSADRAKWKMTGEFPVSSESSRTPDAASSPAEPDAQAAEIAAKMPADSEPAPSSQKRGNAETRKTQLQAEIDELLRRRAQLREDVSRTAPPSVSSSPDAKPAESSPATDGKPPAELLAKPDISQPAMDEDAFWGAYPNATLAQFARYNSRYEVLAYQAEQAHATRVDASAKRYQSQFEQAEQADPDLRSKLPEDFLNANPEIRAGSGPFDFVKREIRDSEHGAAILAHLGQHPAELSRLKALPDAAAVIREMARLEAKVSTSTPTQPTPAKRGISAAPEPTTSLGRRTSVPADEALAAVADGDTRRYMDAENRKALARRASR